MFLQSDSEKARQCYVNIDVITVFSNNESIRGGIDIPYPYLNASNHNFSLRADPFLKGGKGLRNYERKLAGSF